MYISLHVKHSLFLSGLQATWNFLGGYSKTYRISNFIKIRPAFSDFAHARDESSTFVRLVHDVDRRDVAARWRNSGNTKQSDRQWLWLNHTALQPEVWQSDQWPCAPAVCLMERGGSTCSNFLSDTPAEPNMSAVTNNRDTMNSSVAEAATGCHRIAWHLRTALFWAITQRIVVILYRRFGITHRSHHQVSRNQVPIGPHLQGLRIKPKVALTKQLSDSDVQVSRWSAVRLQQRQNTSVDLATITTLVMTMMIKMPNVGTKQHIKTWYSVCVLNCTLTHARKWGEN